MVAHKFMGSEYYACLAMWHFFLIDLTVKNDRLCASSFYQKLMHFQEQVMVTEWTHSITLQFFPPSHTRNFIIH